MKSNSFILLVVVVFVGLGVFGLFRRHCNKVNYIVALSEIQKGMAVHKVISVFKNHDVKFRYDKGNAYTSASIDADIQFGIDNSYTSSLVFNTSGSLVIKETMDTGFF